MRSLLNELEIASNGPWPERLPVYTTDNEPCRMCGQNARRKLKTGRTFSYCSPCHNKRMSEHKKRMREVQQRKNEK